MTAKRGRKPLSTTPSAPLSLWLTAELDRALRHRLIDVGERETGAIVRDALTAYLQRPVVRRTEPAPQVEIVATRTVKLPRDMLEALRKRAGLEGRAAQAVIRDALTANLCR